MATKSWKGPKGSTTKPKSGNWSTSSDWSSSGVPGTLNDVILGGSSTYTVTLDVSATVNSLTINDLGATLAIGASMLNVTGTIDDQSGRITMAGGRITAAGLALDLATTSLSGWGTVVAPLSGSGTVTANGGILDLSGAVDGSGSAASSFQIANVVGSDLRFDSTVGTAAIHPTVAFNGANGLLDLSQETSLSNFQGIVANFGSGDGIKVFGAASATLETNDTKLDVYNSSAALLGTITFASSYSGDAFSVASDGTISVSVPSPPTVTVSDVISGPTDGNNATLNGYYAMPPDNALAVSAGDVLMAENNVIEITDRTGAVLLSPESTSIFFGSVAAGYSLTDPRALVDPLSGKFIVTSDALAVNSSGAVTGSAVVYAISNTTDPVHGGWTFGLANTAYSIGGQATWGDQPTIASNGTYLDITTAQFGVSSGQYVDNYVTIVPLSGGTTTAYNLGGAADYRPVAVAGGDYLVGYIRNPSNDELSIQYNANGNPTFTPSSIALGSIDVGNGSYTAPQLGSSVLLDAGFDDVANAVYANGDLYAAFEVVPTGTTRPAVHWVKVDPVANTVVAQGDITGLPSGAVAFNPSIAVDGHGDVLVNYTLSSASMYPAAYVSVMPAGSSSFLAPVLYGSSVAPEKATFGVTNNVIRWGDYSSAVADGANSFVVSNEIVPSKQSIFNNAPWGTVTATITLSPGTSGAVVASSSTTTDHGFTFADIGSPAGTHGSSQDQPVPGSSGLLDNYMASAVAGSGHVDPTFMAGDFLTLPIHHA